MKERFPGIDWYCDKCDAFLNSQPGFNDHKYTWICTNCGHKNSISRTNIGKNGTGLRKVKRFFELLIAYIEEITYIGFLGAIATVILSIIQGIDLKSLIGDVIRSTGYEAVPYKFMLYCIIGYPIMLIISFLCQKALYFYQGAYIHKSFGEILRSNIAIDIKFPFDFLGPVWRRGDRNPIIHFILKGACFVFIWLIPMILVVWGLLPLIKMFL